MAIVSVLHRISGLVLFLSIALWLWVLCGLKASPEHYQHTVMAMRSAWLSPIVYVCLLALFYHVLAGIRHLIMDIGFAEDVGSARASAWLVIVLEIILAVWLGVSMW